MQTAVLRAVILVSMAHALVHLYELSLPSVEQDIAAEYYPADVAAGKQYTGTMSNVWRLAFGFGAFLAGWLVDRVGATRMLVVYLIGCGGMALLAGLSWGTTSLWLMMFAMGGFASIYHPAGLTLISHEVPVESRTWALGIHGIFGSIGISIAPLLAGLALSETVGWSWRHYYGMLAVPGILLGAYFAFRGSRFATRQSTTGSAMSGEDEARWTSYVVLLVVAAMQGFVYSAMMAFLARYLGDNMGFAEDGARVYGKLFAACVLVIGCVGQFIAGSYAKAARLERWLAVITLANAPFLAWMAYAQGTACAVAAGLFALVHFMYQPVFNSLIAKYTPGRHRSLCYGISFVMGFGVGSFGASFAGYSQSYRNVYLLLAGLAVLSSSLSVVLVTMNNSAEE